MERPGTMKARVKQLDRIAGEINAWLLVLALGLAILDFTVMAALQVPLEQMDQGPNRAETVR